MTAAVVVVVLVATAEAQSPEIAAAVDAAGEALGPRVAMALRTAPTPSDAEARRLAGLLKATAIGTLAWPAGSHDRVIIRVHTASAPTWVEQTVRFEATDSPPERGRALGLTLASMVAPAVDAALGESASVEAPRASPTDALAVPATPAATAMVPPQERGPPPLSKESAIASTWSPGWSADLGALGVRGVGGPGAGWGAAAGVEGAAPRPWGLRVDGAFRSGDVPGLGGRDRVATLGAGVAWHPGQRDRHDRLGWGIRLEVAAVLHDFAHQTVAGSWVHRYRLLPASIGAVEASWRVFTRVDVVANLGGELAWGNTEVVVASIPVATVPVLDLQAQLGCRVWF